MREVFKKRCSTQIRLCSRSTFIYVSCGVNNHQTENVSSSNVFASVSHLYSS